ncbi:hypothetical protein [Bacillus sp. JCM 19041]|uniref:hypothetical protein n=1 Tax=Bacillus sp. JCM 19041 TaxID=1460637 RepID=UPI0006CF91D7
MNLYRVTFFFSAGTEKEFKFQSESQDDVMESLTNNRYWWESSKGDELINLSNVDHIKVDDLGLVE